MQSIKTFGLLGLAVLMGCQSSANYQPTTHSAVVPPLPGPPQTPVSVQKPLIQPAGYAESIPPPIPEPEQLLPAKLPSAGSGTMSLADFEQMALSSNPSIARASALVEAARGNWVQVGLAPNPSVGFEGQQIGSRGQAEQDGVFVEQEFVRGGKLTLNRNVAYQELARAEHQLAAQQLRVMTDVRVAFYQVLIAQRQEALTVELQSIAAESIKTADALQRGKEVGRADVVQAQLEFENVEILVENARNRTRAAWQSLASVVGNPQLSPQPLAGNLDEVGPTLEWQTSLQKLLTGSPEIAAAMADIERARWAAERARVERTPNVTVQGLINWRDNGIGGGPDGGIMVGIPVPLWDRNQGGIVRATQEAAAAERALEQLELSLRNRLAPVFERYSNALNQVTKYRSKILPSARESLELQRKSYEAGETGYVNLLTAQRTFSQTNLNFLESIRELRGAQAEIEGLLLSGSLDSR